MPPNVNGFSPLHSMVPLEAGILPPVWHSKTAMKSTSTTTTMPWAPGECKVTTRNTPPPLAVHLPSHKYPSNPVPLPSFAPDSRSSSRPTHFPPHPPGDGDGRSLDEGQCVQERYEDTNRLLRSVFLHRRQELERTVAQFPGW
ncbi:hypothetical protein OF83DRAFT_394453 [Amylostereum chailletii]|nr:hypothetical protein OF83DRAFT_394453 [Amylostereum chailletii]